MLVVRHCPIRYYDMKAHKTAHEYLSHFLLYTTHVPSDHGIVLLIAELTTMSTSSNVSDPVWRRRRRRFSSDLPPQKGTMYSSSQARAYPYSHRDSPDSWGMTKSVTVVDRTSSLIWHTSSDTMKRTVTALARRMPTSGSASVSIEGREIKIRQWQNRIMLFDVRKKKKKNYYHPIF